ncbi:MAG: DUF1573 domain-containing protein [Prosthecobacter sp.]|uniref:DUF1573 domain-containing protein n=1 Tax=Prosthecobacter sp. TaxID=1965333 RepID=UPI0025CEB130|nr:DUF1573 domain-containing protein [Prosthecobacter sp.]MCF7786546.1 DUF1573 domain-containing protein [Prosthecobacter sp.]
MSASRLTILVFAFAATVHADLSLDVPAIELKPKPEDEEVETTFKFRNTGDKTVKILGLESACSCLSAELDKAEYKPGEIGTGHASFKVSTFVGRHEKFVTVNTDDPNQPDWQINFILDVPAVVDIKPKNLQWWVGDEPDSKACLVQFVGNEPMKIVNITPTRNNVTFTLKEIKEGREYLITVKPKNTEEVTMGALKIETTSSIAKYRYQLAFFTITRKPESQPAAATAATKP